MVSGAPEHRSGAESNHPVFSLKQAQGCSATPRLQPVCFGCNDSS